LLLARQAAFEPTRMSLNGKCRMRCPFLLRFGFALHGLFGGLSLEPAPSCLCCTSACMASHLSLKYHHGEQLVLAHGESMVCARRSSDHHGCVALSSKVFLTAHATSPSLKRCRRRRALGLLARHQHGHHLGSHDHTATMGLDESRCAQPSSLQPFCFQPLCGQLLCHKLGFCLSRKLCLADIEKSTHRHST